MLVQEIQTAKLKKITKRELLDLLEKIPGRIEMLPDKDKAFINLFLASQNFRNIAAAAQVHEATIARRIKKIADRISNNNFVNALSNKNLTPLKMKIMKDYFINDLPMNKIARNNKISYYEVRKLIKSAGKR
ncbi:MAG: hypothetical protein A2Y10_02750 [Planctomycetes bacterium GWF2_41_51]|nr:MAG: hypothetical protein A2Y10_02750 [Planctomycetes bacterium GWF2_41_51]HBG27469.1 hypothetical protein [Phycisphaerales bacterium]